MSATYQVAESDISALRPYARNARTHSKKQIKQIARSIERFGFTNPVLVSDDGEIIVLCHLKTGPFAAYPQAIAKEDRHHGLRSSDPGLRTASSDARREKFQQND